MPGPALGRASLGVLRGDGQHSLCERQHIPPAPLIDRLVQGGQGGIELTLPLLDPHLVHDEAPLHPRLVEADQEDNFNTSSSWVLVSREPSILAVREIAGVSQAVPANSTRLWTDDFSDLLPFLH